MRALVLYVRLHDGRYYGERGWPPAPARLFQALVAGVGLSGQLGRREQEALKWLERQGPPTIGAPHASWAQRGVLFYMPNNDSDRIEGDPLRMAKIRTATKTFRPYLFDRDIPFLYVWSLGQALDEEEHAHARAICLIAERLYQLGRGIDMAWAWGEVLDDAALDKRLAAYPGRIYRPSAGGSTRALLCPCPGSLGSLMRRYEAFGERFRYETNGRSVRVVFRRPPIPLFRPVAYDSPPSRQLYELREPSAAGGFAPWPLERAYELVVRLRDGAVERLKRTIPNHSANIDRALVGRKPDGSNACPPENRVRIIPLPSIGHVQADRQIRRVLVEVSATCPLREADVRWAFSGLDIVDAETGEILAVLTRTEDNEFLHHYGLSDDAGHRVWRTVTPAALPEKARRRRIDPARMREEAKTGGEKRMELERAAEAVRQALRHAGIGTPVEAIVLQREPFEGKGARVELFGTGTRFAKERLWHVGITFTSPVSGPVVIGDGRFLGLGVMAPVVGLSASMEG
jgi:CRISPR-associated protein Csb2